MFSRSPPGDAESSGMGVAVAQPVSPELVLVCPELRAQALALLPELDPDALFEVAPRPPRPLAQVIELRPGAAMAPQRRRTAPVAVAAYFAEALLFGALRGAALIAAIAAIAFLLAR
jgi:hypothetical protein